MNCLHLTVYVKMKMVFLFIFYLGLVCLFGTAYNLRDLTIQWHFYS